MKTLLAAALIFAALLGFLFYQDVQEARVELAAAKQEAVDLRELNQALRALPAARDAVMAGLLEQIALDLARLRLEVDAGHYEEMELIRWVGQTSKEDSFDARVARVRQAWLAWKGLGGGD